MATDFLYNISLFLGILLLVNVPAPFLGLKFEGNSFRKRLWFEPAGSVIPLVWIGLFLILGFLRYQLVLLEAIDVANMLIIFALICSTYAYYTIGLEKLTGISALKFGLFGNALIIISAIKIGIEVAELSIALSYLIYPIVVWTFFASMIQFGQLRIKETIKKSAPF
jgi:tryptophan-rich sensory protein